MKGIPWIFKIESIIEAIRKERINVDSFCWKERPCNFWEQLHDLCHEICYLLPHTQIGASSIGSWKKLVRTTEETGNLHHRQNWYPSLDIIFIGARGSTSFIPPPQEIIVDTKRPSFFFSTFFLFKEKRNMIPHSRSATVQATTSNEQKKIFSRKLISLTVIVKRFGCKEYTASTLAFASCFCF